MNAWVTPLLVVLAQGPLQGGAPPDLPANHPAIPTSEELLKKLDAMGPGLKEKAKTFEISASLGKLYFTQGRLLEAIPYLEQASAKAEPLRARYLKLKAEVGAKPLPAAASIGCELKADTLMEEQQKKIETQFKGQPAKALSCAWASLAGLMEVEVQLGNSKFLSGDVPGALKVHERSLELFESNVESRYARGALLLDTQGDDLQALAQAKKELERFVKDAPHSGHVKQAQAFVKRIDQAIAAGGISKLSAKIPAGPVSSRLPPQLSAEQMAAAQNVEKSAETMAYAQKLIDDAEEHLARGRFQEALDNYKQVMPLNIITGRVKAGMAWSLVKLGKPTADNVWNVASGEPAAIDALGDTLRSKGDGEGAKAVWTKLSQSVPDYGPKLKAKLQ
jgi:tetratricopeptide (TPR) repeat protein